MSLFLSAGSNLSQKPKIKEMKEEVAEKVSGTGLCFLLSRNKGPTSCSSSHLYSFHVVQFLVLKRCECWLNLKPHWLTAVRNALEQESRVSSWQAGKKQTTLTQDLSTELWGQRVRITCAHMYCSFWDCVKSLGEVNSFTKHGRCGITFLNCRSLDASWSSCNMK